MTPHQRKRAEAIKGLIEAGWSPPPPRNEVALRIIEDIASAENYGQTIALSPRERYLLQLFADGHTAETAARECLVTVETIKEGMKKARRKLGAKNTPNAIAIAFRQGLLDVEEQAVAA